MQGHLSAEGRMLLGRTILDEDRLRRVVGMFTVAERRAFWIGVLMRDGVITATDVLRSAGQPAECDLGMPVPERSRHHPGIDRSIGHEAEVRLVEGRKEMGVCTECGGPLPVYDGPGRPTSCHTTCLRARNTRYARWDSEKRRRAKETQG